MSVIRSWQCLNSRCNHCFTAWESNPACPQCGNVRIQWIPGGGHVGGGATKVADAELRALADLFKMRDINSAKTGERAMPKLPVPIGESGPQMTFAPGFAQIPFVKDKQGRAHAVCAPSTQPVSYKAKLEAGSALPKSKSFPGIQTNTAIEARHTGRP